MKRRARILGVLIVFAALFMAGCRVPDDSSPREIPPSQIPFDLLAPSTTAPPATSPVPTADGKIYLVGSDDRLVSVNRSVPAPLLLGSILAALVQGPTHDEITLGYSSSVGPQASVLNVQVMDRSAVIDISDSFSGIGLQQQIVGLAQIVYTATELPGIENVKIQLKSNFVSVPRGDGSTTTDPLTRADYSSLSPR